MAATDQEMNLYSHMKASHINIIRDSEYMNKESVPTPRPSNSIPIRHVTTFLVEEVSVTLRALR